MTTTPKEDNAYSHLTALFAEMAALPGESPDRETLRVQIIESCLPIAENIAARYRGRGQSHDDLVQVARLGLVNAVNRFDLDKGRDFLAFAVPTMMGDRALEIDNRADLAHVRAETTPDRRFHTVHGSAIRRQSRRCRWPVP